MQVNSRISIVILGNYRCEKTVLSDGIELKGEVYIRRVACPNLDLLQVPENTETSNTPIQDLAAERGQRRKRGWKSNGHRQLTGLPPRTKVPMEFENGRLFKRWSQKLY